ncbi:MAG TPA: hypothetical protein VF476_11375 [Chitinophagaceae bacterium]
MKNSLLKRYWFIIYPEDKFGPRNIGATAFSINEAKNLVFETLRKLAWSHITINVLDNAEVIEEIDIQLLDQGHVIPNMGPVNFKGVWFPNCNI